MLHCHLQYGLCFGAAANGSALVNSRRAHGIHGLSKGKNAAMPTCDEFVAQHELVKHLIVEHDMDPVDAGNLTGRVMRRLWSEEE